MLVLVRILAATAVVLTPAAFAATEPGQTDSVDPSTLEMTPAPQDVPLIGFLPPVHDFGDVETGTILEHVFWYTNNGTAPLTVEEARPTGPNTSVGLIKKSVEPGDMGEIDVKLNTEGMEGQKVFRIKVKSDAWNGPSMLYLKANILIGPVSAEPLSDDELVNEAVDELIAEAKADSPEGGA